MTATHPVAVIAHNTFREAVRSRVLYTLLFFAVGLIGGGVLLANLSYVERERILQDMGLESIRLFGAAIAIFMGVGLVHREVDRRTVYTILSKPVSRSAFVLGKYAGLVLTLWLQVAIMGAAFVAVSLLAGAPLTPLHAAAVGLAAAELALVIAVATFFSTFTTPLLASCFTVGIYVIGHLVRDLHELGRVADAEWVRTVTLLLHWTFPDLDAFNLTIPAVHGLPVQTAELLAPLGVCVGYTALLLLFAARLFERRDLR